MAFTGLSAEQKFIELFKTATGFEPYPYQVRLAIEPQPDVLHIPTGLGKTEAVVMAWLWRRRFADKDTRRKTPRRLVYCLPMRVLVEQTRERIEAMLTNLGLAQDISVVTLMGGEDAGDWDLRPEQEAILVGTQDMLLSRALNRGYAMSRFRWPMQFGLLNNDVLWVMDEVQLMGNGLATTAQLQAFRDKFGTMLPAKSLWMSATLNPKSLGTVDFKSSLKTEALNDEDRNHPYVQNVRNARKQHIPSFAATKDGEAEVDFLLNEYQQGSRTLMIVNTVGRAQMLFDKLQKRIKKPDNPPEIVLIHSRFRPEDRKKQVERLLAKPDDNGTIVISTQVVEAGVDVSARLLVTDLAPWSSLVQRFGRCNRKGEYEDARICVIEPLTPLPYEEDDLERTKKRLMGLTDLGPAGLPDIQDIMEYIHVLRRKDIIDLFDTTPDLAGTDIDISRFIREKDEHSVQVFWRALPKDQSPGPDEPAPARNELCSVSIADIKKGKRAMWRWDHLERKWVKPETIYPGIVLMLRSDQGGYDPEQGWTGKTKHTDPVQAGTNVNEANDDDIHSSGRAWITVAEHTDDVAAELDRVLDAFGQPIDYVDELRLAARWHDAGKAHDVFQEAMTGDPPQASRAQIWAKTERLWKETRYKRRGFRHELASAIAVLGNKLPDLAAYLAAAHHGKVRLSIRSMPNEKRPDNAPNRRVARGIWDGDELPATDLGGGETMPRTTLKLNYMEMGEDNQTGPSWLERMLNLRNDLGPFRLAFLEALLRSADWRASANPGQHGAATGQDSEKEVTR